MHEQGFVRLSDGLRLHYDLIGDGPRTLVVPGACLLREDLRHLVDGRRLVFYDSRGRGQSDRDLNPDHLLLDYEPQDLEAVRRHLGLTRMDVLGWSYMGAVVALYAAQHPQQVGKLVMVCPLSVRNPAPYDVDPEINEQIETARIGSAAAARMREIMTSGKHIKEPEWFCREFQRLIVPRMMGRPEAIGDMKSDPCSCPNEWWHNLNEHHRLHAPPETRRGYDWRDSARQVSAPTLVVHGTEDLIPLASSQEWVDVLPDAQLLTIDGAGHYPHLESPDAFFPAVDSFLRDR